NDSMAGGGGPPPPPAAPPPPPPPPPPPAGGGPGRRPARPPAGRREGQTGAAVAAPATTPEAFERPGQLLAAQTRTLVEHVDLDPRTLTLGLDRHDRPGVGHLEGVGEVVVQDLVDVTGHRLR